MKPELYKNTEYILQYDPHHYNEWVNWGIYETRVLALQEYKHMVEHNTDWGWRLEKIAIEIIAIYEAPQD